MAPQVLAGKYVVQEEIASGGMGILYKALDRTLNRIVAIKLVHAHLSGDPSFAERFLREARAMARLQHENIVTIYAVEEDQKTQFLVMEYCPGRNLRDIIRNQLHLPVHDVVSLSRQLASALAYANGHGVIHRDIKPANVLVDKKGKAKLTDFGIAAALDEARITRPQEVIGTPEYMSPEQARGLRLDGRSDLYSLGIVIYEMLTGKTPYAESSGTPILGRLAYDREELTLQFPTQVPLLVQGIVRDLVRRNPDGRIPDAETLAAQLHEIMFTLPQISAFAAPNEPEPTIVSRQPQPPDEEPTRHILQSTVIAPSQESSSNRPISFAARETSSAKNPTIVPLDWSPSKCERQDPISPSPANPTASPRARPLGLIIAVGTLVGGLTIIGLISYFGSQAERSSPESTAPEVRAPLEPSPASTSKAIEEELKPREENLAQLSILLRDTVNRLQTGRQTPDCPDLKALTAETYRKYEEAVHEVDRVRRALEREPVSATSRPTQLDMECEKPPPASQAVLKPKLPKTKPNSAAPAPAKFELPPEASPSSSPVQISRTFPDAQLRSRLEQFKQAYERCDFAALQSLSDMDDRRQGNVKFMFSNYTAFSASIANISESSDGATAVLILETGTRTSGETIPISRMSSHYTLHILHHGSEWGRIVW